MATHFWSELPIEEPGDVMHFLKHFSVTLDNNSWKKKKLRFT
jgi:hypothetical protein